MIHAAKPVAVTIEESAVEKWKGDAMIAQFYRQLVAAGKPYAASLRMLSTKLAPEHTYVIEGTASDAPPTPPRSSAFRRTAAGASSTDRAVPQRTR